MRPKVDITISPFAKNQYEEMLAGILPICQIDISACKEPAGVAAAF
jgi:hypothetical protein